MRFSSDARVCVLRDLGQAARAMALTYGRGNERRIASALMPKLSPRTFASELVSTMRSVLDAAVDQMDEAAPVTKAKMAECILRTASEGVTDARELTNCGDRRKAATSGLGCSAISSPPTLVRRDRRARRRISEAQRRR
jgi:hypothetical protein